MVILVVDDRKSRLKGFAGLLKTLFEKETILCYSDPLLAGKYGFFNPVDILFSAWNMSRLDGIRLEKIIHYANANARVFLTGEKEEFDKADILDAYGRPTEPGIEGVLFYPLKEKAILELVQRESPLQIKRRSKGAEDVRTIEEVYDELLHSDALKQQLIQAALEDHLEDFFRNIGCGAEMDEIQLYFRKRILQQTAHSEEQLEKVQGGADAGQSFRKFILAWAN